MRPLTLSHPFSAYAETAQHKRILGILLESILTKMEVPLSDKTLASQKHQYGSGSSP